MHLAILMCNTDESPFAHRHPSDGQKFTDLIHLARPDWSFEVFAVKDGMFPADMAGFDGAIITGSPASVLSDAPWVAQLLALIRVLHAGRVAMFGVCFGHQAIALALGGQIGDRPGGWFLGLSVNAVVARPARPPWMRDLPDPVRLYGCHKEQVSVLPAGATVVTRAKGCDVTGFTIGRHIFTTQQHPEMTKDFIVALTEELAGRLGTEQVDFARVSFGEPADTVPFATAVARFFEQAVR